MISSPDAVADPRLAALSAAWFWKAHGLNEIADRDHAAVVRAAHDLSPVLVLRAPSAAVEAAEDVESGDETKRVNGGQIGLDERRRLFDRAIAVFG